MDANISGFVAERIVGHLLGFVLSWSIGLFPAIIYRYVIYKKPIEKKKVLRLFAPIVIVLAVFFKIITAVLSGEIHGNPFPWVIIYFVGKWIMTRDIRRRDNSAPQPLSPQVPLRVKAEALSQPVQPVSRPTHATPPERKRGMHGCLLAFLIGIGVALVGLPLGIYLGGKAVINYAKESFEKSPLYLAVASNNIAEVDRLLMDGANPNEKGMMGHSPLIMAVRCDYSLIVEYLLKAGANPNQKDNLQWAPLHHAVKTDNANLDMITMLVHFGADANIADSHLRTPLHRAAQFGHVEAVRLLLSLGANPIAKDENGWTPLDRGAAHPVVRQVLGGGG